MHSALAQSRSQEVRDIRKTGIDPDYWYPVARGRDLEKGKTLAVQFAGEPIVLVRTEKGQLYALEDRCAHRQVPLSEGVVRGELLQCGYHCWTYDRTGRCVAVPYLREDQKKPPGVHGYPCREAYGLIFVFPGNAAKASERSFPEIDNFSNPGYKTRYLDRRVDCHYSFMQENLMDMNHQFLHRKLMGWIKTTMLDVRSGEGFVEVDYTFDRVGGRQSFGERFIIGGSGKKQPEARDLMTIRTEYPYQILRFWPRGKTEPALDLWNVYIPIDREQRVNHTFGLMMIKRPPIPGILEVLWPMIIWFTEGIFREDRWIVELEQKAFDAQGEDWNNEIFPPIRALRRLLVDRGVPLEV